jgi:uncharacterized membrane protein YgcG
MGTDRSTRPATRRALAKPALGLVAATAVSVLLSASAAQALPPPPSPPDDGGAIGAPVNQCTQGFDVAPGHEVTLATKFFGSTIVRLRNKGDSDGSWFWWSSSSFGGGSLGGGSSYDMNRSFIGFRVGVHNTGSATLNVTTPYGPC